MLNIRNITFAWFTVLWVLFNFTSLHYSFYIGATLVYLVIPIGSSLFICANLYLKAMCKWKTDKDEVILSFNLPYRSEKMLSVVEVLKKLNINAIIFCAGEAVSNSPDLLTEKRESGIVLGNYSWTITRKFGFMGARKLITELANTEELIFDPKHNETKYFRPPYGITNPSVKKATEIMGYKVIGWNKNIALNRLTDQRNLDNEITKIRKGNIIRVDISDDLDINLLEKFLTNLTKDYTVADIQAVFGTDNQ